jgi:hypothetical protein
MNTSIAFTGNSVLYGASVDRAPASILLAVDAQLPDLELLLQGLSSEVVVLPLSREVDAIEAIDAALASCGASRLVMLCHGRPGALLIGSRPITEALIEERAQTLSAWKLTSVQLYACHLAADLAMVQRLQELLACPVAASANAVGHPSQKASWDLEWLATGATTHQAPAVVGNSIVPFQPRALAAWRHQLATLNVGVGQTYTTIQAAITAAAAGDTIVVAAGTYAENVTVNKTVTIQGANTGIAGSASRNAESTIEGTVTITAAATLDGFLLTKPDSSTATNGINFTGWNGINARVGSGGKISHTIVEAFGAGGGFAGSGFVTFTADDATLEKSLVKAGTGYTALLDNRGVASVAVGAAGTYVIDGNSLQVSTNNADALNIFGGNVTVKNNTISGVDGGIVAYGFGTQSFTGLTITGNNISGYNDNGIRVINYPLSTDATVTIYSNSVTGVNPLTVDTNGFLKYVIDVDSPAAALTTREQLREILADNTGISTLTAEKYVSFTPQSFTLDGASMVAAYIGNDVANTLSGNAGVNLLQGNGGNDTLAGGADNDTAIYAATLAGSAVTAVADIDAATAGNQPGWQVVAGGAEGTDILSGIEIVDGAESGKFLLVGNGGFATIQAAITAASAGDTIVVAAGTYTENLTVDKAITLLGANAGIAGSGSRSSESVIQGKVTVSAGATLDGFKVLNTSSGGTFTGSTYNSNGVPQNGIEVTALTNIATVQLFNNVIWASNANGGDTDRAISLTTAVAGNVAITGNLISGDSPGLYGTASWNRGIWSDGGNASLTINNNVLSYVRTAFNLDSFNGATTTASNNSISNSGSGFSFGFNAVNLALGNITNNSFNNVDTDFNLQNITSSNSVNFDLAATGNQSSSGQLTVLLAGAGSDSLKGTNGSDLFRGRAGNDTLDGGDGSDTADFSDKTTAVVLTLNGATNATASIGGVAEDTIVNIENIIGGSAADTLTGDGLGNTLTGNAGNDTLSGGDGSDLLVGGADNDTAIYAATLAGSAFTTVADIDAATAGRWSQAVRKAPISSAALRLLMEPRAANSCWLAMAVLPRSKRRLVPR